MMGIAKKIFSSQLRINMFSGVAVTVISFGITALSYPLYLHFLGYEKYGVWLVMSTVLTFAQLGHFGINGAITKIVAEEYGRGNIKAIQQYVTVAIGLLLLSGVAILTAVLFLKLSIANAFHLTDDNKELVLWLLPYIGLLSVYVFLVESCNATLVGLGRMDLANSAQAIGRLSALGGSSLLLFMGYGIKSLLVANFVSYLLINLQSIIHIRRIIKTKMIKIDLFDYHLVRRLITFGSGVFASSAINMLFDPFNKLMLSRYAGVSSIPVYDLAFRGTMQIRGVIDSSLKALMPEISRIAARIDISGIKRIYQLNIRSFKVILISAALIFLPSYFFVTSFLQMWLHKNFVTDLPFAFRINLLSVFVSLLAVPAYYSLLGLGKIRHILLGHVLVSLLNITSVTIIIYAFPGTLAHNIYFAILVAQCGPTFYLNWRLKRELRLLENTESNAAPSKLSENEKIDNNALSA